MLYLVLSGLPSSELSWKENCNHAGWSGDGVGDESSCFFSLFCIWGFGCIAMAYT